MLAMGEMERGRSGSRRRARAVAVWFDERDIAQLKAIARDKGIGHTTLIRMWVKEKLTELKQLGDSAG